MLPTKKQFEYSARHVGLKCIEKISFGGSYAKTLKIWNTHNFKNLGLIYQGLVSILNLKECGNFIFHIVKQVFQITLLMFLIF